MATDDLGTFQTRAGWTPSMQDLSTNPAKYQGWDKFIDPTTGGFNIPITPDLQKMLGQNQDIAYMRGFGDQNPNYVTGQNWSGYGGQYTDSGRAAMLKQLEDFYSGSALHSKTATGSSLVGQFLNPQNIYDAGMAGKGASDLPSGQFGSVNITQARDSIPSIRRQFGDAIANQFSDWVDNEIKQAQPGTKTLDSLPSDQKALIDAQSKPVSLPENSANWANVHAGLLGTPHQASVPTTVDAVYQQILGRAPDAEGKAFWESQLASGALTPDTLAQAIAQSAANFDVNSYQGNIPANVLAQSVQGGKNFLANGMPTTYTPNPAMVQAPVTPVQAPRFGGLFGAPNAGSAITNSPVSLAGLFGAK